MSKMIKDKDGFEYEDVFHPDYRPPNLIEISKTITKKDESEWRMRFQKNLKKSLGN